MANPHKIFSTVTTFDMDNRESCNLEQLGGFSNATHRLHSVDVHDVTNVTRKTRTLKCGHKVVVITLHTPHGDITINGHA